MLWFGGQSNLAWWTRFSDRKERVSQESGLSNLKLLPMKCFDPITSIPTVLFTCTVLGTWVTITMSDSLCNLVRCTGSMSVVWVTMPV